MLRQEFGQASLNTNAFNIRFRPNEVGLRPPSVIPGSRDVTNEFDAILVNWINYNRVPLTAGMITGIMTNADYGWCRDQAALLQAILQKEPVLLAHLQTRIQTVISLKWSITSDENDNLKAESIEKQLRKAGIVTLIEHLLDAIPTGYSGALINWAAGGGSIDSFTPVHPCNWIFDAEGNPAIVLEDGRDVGLNTYHPYQFVFHKHQVMPGIPSIGGLARCLIWLAFYKHYGMKHRARYLEKFGIPFLVTKISDSDFANETTRASIKEALRNIGADGAGVFTQGSDIQPVMAGAQGENASFQQWFDYLDKVFAITVLGQEATSKSATGFSQGNVQAQVRQDILAKDCNKLMETLNECVVRPMEWYRYRTESLKFNIQYEPPEDLDKKLNILAKIQAAGFKVDPKWVNETFNVPLENEGKQTAPAALPPPPPSAPPGGGGGGGQDLASLIAAGAPAQGAPMSDMSLDEKKKLFALAFADAFSISEVRRNPAISKDVADKISDAEDTGLAIQEAVNTSTDEAEKAALSGILTTLNEFAAAPESTVVEAPPVPVVTEAVPPTAALEEPTQTSKTKKPTAESEKEVPISDEDKAFRAQTISRKLQERALTTAQFGSGTESNVENNLDAVLNDPLYSTYVKGLDYNSLLTAFKRMVEQARFNINQEKKSGLVLKEEEPKYTDSFLHNVALDAANVPGKLWQEALTGYEQSFILPAAGIARTVSDAVSTKKPGEQSELDKFTENFERYQSEEDRQTTPEDRTMLAHIAYGVARMSPVILASMVPGGVATQLGADAARAATVATRGSQVLFGLSGAGESYNSMVNAGVDPSVAAGLSLLNGAAQAATQSRIMNLLLPNAFNSPKAKTTISRTFNEAFTKTAKDLTSAAAETGAQTALGIGAQQISDTLAKNITDQLKGTALSQNAGAMDILKNVASGVASMAPVLGTVMLGGHAKNIYHEFKEIPKDNTPPAPKEIIPPDTTEMSAVARGLDKLGITEVGPRLEAIKDYQQGNNTITGELLREEVRKAKANRTERGETEKIITPTFITEAETPAVTAEEETKTPGTMPERKPEDRFGLSTEDAAKKKSITDRIAEIDKKLKPSGKSLYREDGGLDKSEERDILDSRLTDEEYERLLKEAPRGQDPYFGTETLITGNKISPQESRLLAAHIGRQVERVRREAGTGGASDEGGGLGPLRDRSESEIAAIKNITGGRFIDSEGLEIGLGKPDPYRQGRAPAEPAGRFGESSERLGGGAEADVFRGDGDGFVYKIFTPDADGTYGGKLVYKDNPEGGKPVLDMGRQTAGDVLEKAYALGRIGGVPTELNGVSRNKAIVMKQPFGDSYAFKEPEASALDRARMIDASDLFADNRVSGSEPTTTFAAVVDGVPYLIGDIRTNNFVADTKGRTRVSDLLLRRITPEDYVRIPGLESRVSKATELEKASAASRAADRADMSFRQTTNIKAARSLLRPEVVEWIESGVGSRMPDADKAKLLTAVHAVAGDDVSQEFVQEILDRPAALGRAIDRATEIRLGQSKPESLITAFHEVDHILEANLTADELTILDKLVPDREVRAEIVGSMLAHEFGRPKGMSETVWIQVKDAFKKLYDALLSLRDKRREITTIEDYVDNARRGYYKKTGGKGAKESIREGEVETNEPSPEEPGSLMSLLPPTAKEASLKPLEAVVEASGHADTTDSFGEVTQSKTTKASQLVFNLADEFITSTSKNGESRKGLNSLLKRGIEHIKEILGGEDKNNVNIQAVRDRIVGKIHEAAENYPDDAEKSPEAFKDYARMEIEDVLTEAALLSPEEIAKEKALIASGAAAPKAKKVAKPTLSPEEKTTEIPPSKETVAELPPSEEKVAELPPPVVKIEEKTPELGLPLKHTNKPPKAKALKAKSSKAKAPVKETTAEMEPETPIVSEEAKTPETAKAVETEAVVPKTVVEEKVTPEEPNVSDTYEVPEDSGSVEIKSKDPNKATRDAVKLVSMPPSKAARDAIKFVNTPYEEFKNLKIKLQAQEEAAATAAKVTNIEDVESVRAALENSAVILETVAPEGILASRVIDIVKGFTDSLSVHIKQAMGDKPERFSGILAAADRVASRAEALQAENEVKLQAAANVAFGKARREAAKDIRSAWNNLRTFIDVAFHSETQRLPFTGRKVNNDLALAGEAAIKNFSEVLKKSTPEKRLDAFNALINKLSEASGRIDVRNAMQALRSVADSASSKPETMEKAAADVISRVIKPSEADPKEAYAKSADAWYLKGKTSAGFPRRMRDEPFLHTEGLGALADYIARKQGAPGFYLDYPIIPEKATKGDTTTLTLDDLRKLDDTRYSDLSSSDLRLIAGALDHAATLGRAELLYEKSELRAEVTRDAKALVDTPEFCSLGSEKLFKAKNQPKGAARRISVSNKHPSFLQEAARGNALPINLTKFIDGKEDGILQKVFIDEGDAAENIKLSTSEDIKIEISNRLAEKGFGVEEADLVSWSGYLYESVESKIPLLSNTLDKAAGKIHEATKGTVAGDKLPTMLSRPEVKSDLISLGGEPTALSVGQMMTIYLHAKTTRGMKALVETNEVTLPGEEGTKAKVAVSPDEVVAIEDHLSKNYPKAKAIADVMYDMANGSLQEIFSDTFQSVKGVRLPLVEGGYWPQTKWDFKSQPKDAMGNVISQPPAIANLSSAGRFKEAKGGASLVIDDAFETFYNMTQYAAAYKGYAKYTQKMRNLLDYRVGEVDVYGQIRVKFGEDIIRQLAGIADRAQGSALPKDAANFVEHVSLWARAAFSSAVIPLSPTAILSNPFTLVATHLDLSAKGALPGAKAITFDSSKAILLAYRRSLRWIRDAPMTFGRFEEELLGGIDKASPYLKDRRLSGLANPAVSEVVNTGEATQWWTGRKSLRSMMFAPLRSTDAGTMTQVAIDCGRKVLADHGYDEVSFMRLPQAEKESLFKESAGLTSKQFKRGYMLHYGKDRPEVADATGLLRALDSFIIPFVHMGGAVDNWNIDRMIANRDHPENVKSNNLRCAVKVGAFVAMMAAYTELQKQLVALPKMSQDDREKFFEAPVSYLAKDTAGEALNTLFKLKFITGVVLPPLVNYTLGLGKGDFKPELSTPGMEVFNSALDSASTSTKYLSEKWNGTLDYKKSEKYRKDLYNSTAMLLGATTKLPIPALVKNNWDFFKFLTRSTSKSTSLSLVVGEEFGGYLSDAFLSFYEGEQKEAPVQMQKFADASAFSPEVVRDAYALIRAKELLDNSKRMFDAARGKIESELANAPDPVVELPEGTVSFVKSSEGTTLSHGKLLDTLMRTFKLSEDKASEVMKSGSLPKEISSYIKVLLKKAGKVIPEAPKIKPATQPAKEAGQ